MGAENSKNEQKYIPRSNQGVSRDEVNQLLEQQRIQYEKKLQELKVRQAAVANTSRNQTVPVAREASTAHDKDRKDIDRIIGQQVQDFVQIAYNNNTNTLSTNNATQSKTPTTVPTGVGSSASTSGHINMERERNPYSYTKENLPKSPQTTLYPNLDTANANFTSLPVINRPLERKGFNSNSSAGSGDFVFVNKNYTNTCGYQPSAPPLPTGYGPAGPTGFGPMSPTGFGPMSPTGFGPMSPTGFGPGSPTGCGPMSPTVSGLPAQTGAIKKKIAPKQRNRDVDEQFNCKTCGNKFGLTIFQCSKGHSSCADCKSHSLPCGICRSPIGDTRNIDVEKLISERKVKCPNSDDGCTVFVKMVDIKAHLKECPYGDFVCPLFVLFGQRERCRWKGKLPHIVSHFDEVHPEHRQAKIDTEMVLINILDDNHIVHLIDMYPYVFLVHLKIFDEERKINMTVQLLGTQMSASKWFYELHVYNKREPRRKFLHTDICYSNVTPIDEIFNESKCVVIPQSYASSFVNDGCLNYKFFIKKDADDSFAQRREKRASEWRERGRNRGRGRGARAGN